MYAPAPPGDLDVSSFMDFGGRYLPGDGSGGRGFNVAPYQYNAHTPAGKSVELICKEALDAANLTLEWSRRAQRAAAAVLGTEVALAGMSSPVQRMPTWATSELMSKTPTSQSRPKGVMKLTGENEAGGGTPPSLPIKKTATIGQSTTIEMDTFQVDADEDECEQAIRSISLPNLQKHIVQDGESVEAPSIGSRQHPGDCTPCAWFWKPGSCTNQQDCRYCHLCEEGELKRRKKVKVQKMRAGQATPKLNLASLIQPGYDPYANPFHT
mmetsp:Transcript_59904/g.104786  ORF Transcript_59904/g.104786 Transcript_59904/m.104786 type:complete len:268 (+) Transcript_59904:103-906(+)